MHPLLQINWTDIQYSSREIDRDVYSFPLHLRVLFVITICFLLVTLLLLMAILTSRIVKTSRALKRKDLQKAFQPILSELLFGGEANPDEGTIRSRFEPIDTANLFIRKVLCEEIIHLHDNFTGDSAIQLEKIFRSLGLHEDCLKKLDSKRWHVVAAGMRECALMNIREAAPKIARFLESKNEMLRYESRITTMKLSEDDPLSFLDHEHANLSEWDRSYIYTMLTKMPDKAVPDFSRWINSGNPSIVDFSISMIGAFHQQSSVPKLIGLLESADEKRRVLIIRSLRKCGATSAEDVLIKRYERETPVVRDEIVQSFATLGSNRSVEFLSGLLKKGHEEISHTVHILRSLLAIGPDGERIVNDAFLRGEERLRTAILHAKDQRL